MARWGNPRDHLRWPLRLSHEKLGKNDFTIFAYFIWFRLQYVVDIYFGQFHMVTECLNVVIPTEGTLFLRGVLGAAILMLSSTPQLVPESCDMQVASCCSLILFGYVEYILRHLMNVRNKSKQWGQTLHGAAILHVPTFQGHRYVVHRPGATALPQLGVWVGM
jgi:hypothetical protein